MRKALYILSILEDSDIEWLAQNGAVTRVPNRSVLIEEGKPIDHLHFMLDGELSVRVGGREGTEVARLLSGEIVGEMSFVDTRPPSASVVATQDSQVLSLERGLLSRKLETDGPFAARFYRAIAWFLADRLHVTVGRFGYGSPKQDSDVDEIDDASMDNISLASVRFDSLLKRLQADPRGTGTTLWSAAPPRSRAASMS
jgi:CRP/FNR family transcriptional regulator, cyclic AMP receptor protein